MMSIARAAGDAKAGKANKCDLNTQKEVAFTTALVKAFQILMQSRKKDVL